MTPLALVIEDDEGTRKLLNVLLTRSGLDVDIVGSIADARLLLERVDYSIVVLDLLLSDGNGRELLGWLRERRPDVTPRVAVLSSAPEAQLADVRDTWPEVKVIRKPFELSDMNAAAERAKLDAVVTGSSPAQDFCRRSVRAGAKAGVVVMATGQELAPVFDFGYEAKPEVVDQYFPLPVSTPVPICAAVRTGRPVWLASLTVAQTDYPLLVPVWEKNESRALAVIPLVADGVVVGAAGWSFREPRAFGEAEQREFAAIAEIAATLLPPSGSAVAVGRTS